MRMSARRSAWLLLTLMLAVSSEAIDYCTISSCPSNSHTLCKYSNDGVADTCPQILGRGMSEDDKSRILLVHNNMRTAAATNFFGGRLPIAQPIPNMTWDDELAAAAQRWADQCPKGESDQCRDVQRFPVEQLTLSTLDDTMHWSTSLWYKAYNEFWQLPNLGLTYFSENGFKYLTQMLWANTTQLGCGFIAFAEPVDDPFVGPRDMKRQTLVCNYGPKGNIEGQLIYQPAI